MTNPETDYDIGAEKVAHTFHKKVGCGSIYVIVVEHKNGNFDRILINGKMTSTTPCGDSWLFGMANDLTFSLRRAFREDGNCDECSKWDNRLKQLGVEEPKFCPNCGRSFKRQHSLEKGIIKQLLFHCCNNYSVATEKSCISAIGRALDDYLKMLKERGEK